MTSYKNVVTKTRSGWAAALARNSWTRFRVDHRFKLFRYATFGIAVSIGYTLNVVLFVELLGWNPEFASALSFVIWTPISYLGHREFTFLFAGDRVSSALKFTAAFIVRLAASAYTVYVAAYFGMHYLVGVMANWIVLPLISYFILDLWVFRTTRRRSTTPTPSELARSPGG